jgi:hypothetical protein
MPVVTGAGMAILSALHILPIHKVLDRVTHTNREEDEYHRHPHWIATHP